MQGSFKVFHGPSRDFQGASGEFQLHSKGFQGVSGCVRYVPDRLKGFHMDSKGVPESFRDCKSVLWDFRDVGYSKGAPDLL